MARVLLTAFYAAALTIAADAQTPQPFPRPGSPQPARTVPAAPQPAAPAPATQQTSPSVGSVDPNAPTPESLGVAIYPTAQFLASYDAGRGQRYYLFGTTASFDELVGYYKVQTKQNGDLVFKDPPTHMFTGGTLARFREETMAFPPSVTVKDWGSGGSSGYPNPKIGAQPQRFPTIIMIVPPPPGIPASR